ncbi:DUF1203 domain-containing protein [Roseovarius sp. CH_XMU1461]|uniref:DUF1203 domain-containing protein n=1 Tax=Roseovarius sp. CH_XMU1461 TaxID=3107777 RepID=UPI00300AB3EB
MSFQSFQITALPRARFAPLFALTDAALAKRAIHRVTAEADHGYPCRISLEDARAGETLLLLNYQHLDIASPYAARHAIYLRETAPEARPAPGDIPPALSCRMLSLRGFDEAGMMQAAELAQGGDCGPILTALLARPDIAFVDLHNAAPGCFAARAYPCEATGH